MRSWIGIIIVLMSSLIAGLIFFTLPLGLPLYGSTLGPGLGAIFGAFFVIIAAKAVERHLDEVNRVDYVHEAPNLITFIIRMATWLFIGLLILFPILLSLVSPTHHHY